LADKEKKPPDTTEALVGVGRAVLVSGGFAVVSLVISICMLFLSSAVAFALFVWTKRASAPFFVLVLLAEVVVITLAVGFLLVGVTLFLKSMGDALSNLAIALGSIGDAWELERGAQFLGACANGVALKVRALTRWAAETFKLAHGGRKRAFLLLMAFGLFVVVTSAVKDGIRGTLEPPGIQLIVWATQSSMRVLKLLAFYFIGATALHFILPKAGRE